MNVQRFIRENHYMPTPEEINKTSEIQKNYQENNYNQINYNVHHKEYINVDQSLQIIDQAELQYNPGQEFNEYVEVNMYGNQYDSTLVSYNNQEMKYGNHNLVNFNDREIRSDQNQISNFL